MTELTRRRVLLGAAAATTLTAVGPGPRVACRAAAAPPAGKQAPGWAYRYKVGSIEVTAVTDGARTMPLADNYVKNAPKDAVNAALDARYMERTKITRTLHARSSSTLAPSSS